VRKLATSDPTEDEADDDVLDREERVLHRNRASPSATAASRMSPAASPCASRSAGTTVTTTVLPMQYRTETVVPTLASNVSDTTVTRLL
jgi:hypothetical protein